jgi:peptidyl-prolyl cis-trans isomerase C
MIKIPQLPNLSSVTPFLKSTGAVLLLFILGACGEKPEGAGRPLAIINGKAITISEFDLRWSQMPEYVRKKYPGAEGRKKFLDELIDREVLLQEARKRGIDRDRALMERLERFKERSILDVLVREEVDARVAVSPEDMKAYYDAHLDNFASAEQFRASHILVKTNAEAEELKKRLAQGEDFATVARKTSVDTLTKSKGGDLGILKKGQAAPEFERVLVALKPGEVSEPVATQFGYHLIKLVDRTTGPALSYEAAKDQVKEQVMIEKKQQRFKELVASLRAQAKVRVSDAPIPDTNSRAATPAADAQ